MTAITMIRWCRRLSTTFLSKHSSPFNHHQPPRSTPPPQPSTLPPFQNPFFPPHSHFLNTPSPTSLTLIRWFSSSSPSSSSPSTASTTTTTTSSNGSNSTMNGENLKHQEIEGPTVERDLSPLANETRQVTNNLLKTMYNVSTFFALLGLAHLALGAYSYTIASSSSSTSTSVSSSSSLTLMISALAFGFPFSMAFMLRQSLKSMHFFEKMETLGRLQILTSTMQIFKHLHLFFVRVRALSFLCLAGLSFSFLYSISSSL